MTEDLKGSVIAALQGMLAEIEGYEVLPDPGTAEAIEMGLWWDIRFDALTEKKQQAVNLSLMLLPPDAGAVIAAIEKAVYERQQGPDLGLNHGDRVVEEPDQYGVGTVRYLNGDLVPDGSGKYYDWPGWICVEFDREIDGIKPLCWRKERKLHRLTDGGEKR